MCALLCVLLLLLFLPTASVCRHSLSQFQVHSCATIRLPTSSPSKRPYLRIAHNCPHCSRCRQAYEPRVPLRLWTGTFNVACARNPFELAAAASAAAAAAAAAAGGAGGGAAVLTAEMAADEAFGAFVPPGFDLYIFGLQEGQGEGFIEAMTGYMQRKCRAVQVRSIVADAAVVTILDPFGCGRLTVSQSRLLPVPVPRAR